MEWVRSIREEDARGYGEEVTGERDGRDGVRGG